MALHAFLLLPFVDDVFILQSTCHGLRRACNGLTEFTKLWRHNFAGGRNSATFLAIGVAAPEAAHLTPMGNDKPEHVYRLGVET